MAETEFAHSEGMLVMKEVNVSVVKVIRHAAKFRSYSLPPGHACKTQGYFNDIGAFKWIL